MNLTGRGVQPRLIMPIFFTQHAKDRMRERNIGRQEVEDCLENYQTKYDDESGDCVNYIHTSSGGRRIRVVVREKGKHKLAISVMD